MPRCSSAPVRSVVLVLGLVATNQTVPSHSALDSARPRIISGYGKVLLHFEANLGQTASDVNFLARGKGYGLFLSGTDSMLVLRKQDKGAMPMLRFKLLGSNPAPVMTGNEELPGKSNYFIGNDPTRWRTNVAHYARVELAGVYPGIDLTYYGNQGQLEYDFVVKPGGDPREIRFAVDGAERIRVDDSGNLVLGVPGGEVVQRAPLIYQEADGVRRTIDGHFAMRGPREIGFEVGPYSPDQPLVVDPVLVYSTYLGGSDLDEGHGIAVDSSGSAYVAGLSASVNFPTASPMQAGNAGGYDAFVTKLSPSGALVYSTYLGGSDGDGAVGIAVDDSGDAHIAGYTGSHDFPISNAVQAANGGLADAFVAKLNPSGSVLLYSTYLGGSAPDQAQAIAIDAAGSAYITGITQSTNFPTVGAIQAGSGGGIDAFVAKFNSTGSAIVYSTYLGGGSTDLGYGVATDTSGNAYVTGQTVSNDFPTVNALQTSPSGTFVTKLNAAGSGFVYSTYFGGGPNTGIYGVAADASGNAYVVGVTASTTFPVVNAFQPVYGGGVGDGFVSKINAAGSALVYSTYLGGGGDDTAWAVAVDASGRAYVTGSAGPSFPIVNSFQEGFGGAIRDAFVSKLDTAGSSLVYSSYLGGGGASEFGLAIAVDTAGSAYVTGITDAADFPTVHPVQPAYGGGARDAFVAKIGERGPWQFFVLTPCRFIDTAGPPGPAGGPALAANSTRTFPVAGTCGIPASAKAVAVNVTTAEQPDAGHLRVYAAGDPLPPTSTINFIVNQTRANNAIVALGTAGQIAVTCVMPPGSTGTTRLIVDVTGYFE